MKSRLPRGRGRRASDDLVALGHAMKMRALTDYFLTQAVPIIETADAEESGGETSQAQPIAKRRGPKKGNLRRYEAGDRQLFPEIEDLMNSKQISASEAALRLARAEKVAGRGSSESRAKRLAKLYLAECRGDRKIG